MLLPEQTYLEWLCLLSLLPLASEVELKAACSGLPSRHGSDPGLLHSSVVGASSGAFTPETPPSILADFVLNGTDLSY